MEHLQIALVLIGEPGQEPILLEPGRNTVGRSSSNLISVSDQSVSRHHMVLHVADGQVMVEDLNSAAGTFVNQDQVLAFAKAPAQPGDILTMGNCRCQLVQAVVEEPTGNSDLEDDERTIISEGN